MRKLALAAGAVVTAAAFALAAPAAAFADGYYDHDDGLLVDLNAAVAADVDLGEPAVLPLCLGDRYEVTVIDRVRDTRTAHCVDADVAADLDAVTAVR